MFVHHIQSRLREAEHAGWKKWKVEAGEWLKKLKQAESGRSLDEAQNRSDVQWLAWTPHDRQRRILRWSKPEGAHHVNGRGSRTRVLIPQVLGTDCET